MRKSELHTAYFLDDLDKRVWRSLPPHVPGQCRGINGKQCPSSPDEPCAHKHRSSDSANECSRNREPFEYDENIWDVTIKVPGTDVHPPQVEFEGEVEFARKYATGKHFQIVIQEMGQQRGRIPYTKAINYTTDELMEELPHLLSKINMDTQLTIKRNK